MGKYILAHDLGTSGNKATLFSLEGKLGAGVLCEYPVLYPGGNAVEQDPEDYWKAVCLSTRQLLEKAGVQGGDVEAVCFSGQMMGCLLVDSEGRPLRNILIWADSRAGRQEQDMIRRAGMEKTYRITGHRISASYSAAKLLWIRENEPEIFRRSHKMLLAKDYIIFKLTGKFVTDYSDASGTNLFNLTEKKWDREILKALDISEDLLPEVRPSTDRAGGITREAAEETGLITGTPVIIGGGDGSCA
jgi:xylulokinase